MIGSRLGDWVLESELGSGGMGNVYRARKADSPDEWAAVKVLAPELAREAGFRQRFEREIEAVRKLSHPNVVRFLEAGEQDGRYYYVMEYVPGKDFDRILEERGRLDWKEVTAIALQVTAALKHAHDHGVIHRDLKPHNLLQAEDGTVKLTDFGIAKVFAARQLSTTGTVVGTAEYMAPELAAGKPASPRSDLYSLGVVLYVLLTGRPPFKGTSVAELLHQHRFGQFDRPRRIVPAIPLELDELVCQLLEKDPEDRPANALVLQRQLEAIRRRAERREQQTEITDVPKEKPEPGTGPATLMSRLVRQELERQNRGGPLARLFNQPIVLIVLFAVCLAVLIWRLWLRPTQDPEALWQEGRRLMASENPANWDRAWNNYLGPLNQDFPQNPHRAEVERLHQQMQDREQLNRALARLNTVQPHSEAERFYLRGLEQCRQGDASRAGTTWQALIDAFRDEPNAERWVKLAQAGLAGLDIPQANRQTEQELQQALARVEELRKQGKADQANAILNGLEELYRNDPLAHPLIKAARRKP